jgi:hypothetical protein
MIPLTLLGSVPRMGCICANGDRKLLCERHLSPVDAPCACCFGRVNAKDRGTAGSRHKLKQCCDTGWNSRTEHGSSCVSAHRPCRAVLNTPQLLTKAKVEYCAHELAGQFVPVPELIEPQFVLHNAACEFGRDGDLPPPDLVIIHRVFLI